MAEIPTIDGVHHVDGPLAQIRQMADWADGLSDPTRNADWETAGKIAKNLRAAADALAEPTDEMVEKAWQEVPPGIVSSPGMTPEDEAAMDDAARREISHSVLLAALSTTREADDGC